MQWTVPRAAAEAERWIPQGVFMRLLAVALLSWLLAGCGLQSIKLYDGPGRASSEHSTLSSIGLYREIKLSLQVLAVNGAPVNTTTAASFYLLPGTHRVTVRARKDMKTGAGPTGFTVSFKEATLDGILEAKPGRTYIPAALIQDETIRLLFDDKGTGFPQECLPLYVEVNGGGNPGYLVHRDGRKCEF